MRLPKAVELVGQQVEEPLAYHSFPSDHWHGIRTNNSLRSAAFEKSKSRTRGVGTYPDGQFALNLVAAKRRHIASAQGGKRHYLVMDSLLNPAQASGRY
jgi:putative transposase